jgi:glutamine cyclotransferase
MFAHEFGLALLISEVLGIWRLLIVDRGVRSLTLTHSPCVAGEIQLLSEFVGAVLGKYRRDSTTRRKLWLRPQTRTRPRTSARLSQDPSLFQQVEIGLLFFSRPSRKMVYVTVIYAALKGRMAYPILWSLLFSVFLTGPGCGKGGPPTGTGSTPATAGYEVVNVFPHDSAAYTQGLVFDNGTLLESTGQVGRSSLRRVQLETGDVLQRVTVPPPYFAEGLTLFNGKIYQLTWQDQIGFIYDASSFSKIGEFKYYGEGWGLTHDSESLILIDGTNRLRLLDPTTIKVKRMVKVLDRGVPVRELNELEYVNGEIFANVWHEDRIARIEPQTGNVLGWILLKGLMPASELSDDEAVLNGIAYDERNQRFFVTGKLWPRLFEIRIKQQ